MEVIKKIGIIILIFTLILAIGNSTVWAADDDDDSSETVSTEDILQGATDFINQGSGNSPINEENLKNASDMIYNTLLAVGLVLAIIWAFFLGIKFMTGSVEEQAKVKESVKVFIIGCIVLFGAFGIWRLVLVLTQGIDDLSETSQITTVEIAKKI